MNADNFDEWIVVLEYVPSDRAPIGYHTLRAMVDELQAFQPAALFAHDRYALQLRVLAYRPLEAIRRGMELHESAAGMVAAPGAALARIEVLTRDEFESQRYELELADRTSAPRQLNPLLSEDLYGTTRAMLHATGASELTNALVSFVIAVGGQIATGWPDSATDQVVVDLSLGAGDDLHAVADHISVAGLIIEQSLPTLVADALAVLRRLRQFEVSDQHHLPPA